MNLNNAYYEASFGTFAQLPKSDVCEIAFAGRSNVGKSSLLNKVLNRKSLARTSSTPGKTTTVNFFRAGDVRLVDLPGYGFAKVNDNEKKRWADLMDGYFTSGRDIRLVIQLVDMRHPLSADDRQMLCFLSETGYKFVIVATKSDKLNKTEYVDRLNSLKDETAELGIETLIIPFSSLKGEGVDRVRDEMLAALQK